MKSKHGRKFSGRGFRVIALNCSFATIKYFLMFALIFSLASCISKNKVKVTLKNTKKSDSLNITVSNIQVINHQIIITGTNLTKVSNFEINEGNRNAILQIESQTSTSLVANTLTNVSFAAGNVFDFVFSSAQAAAVFSVNFSLCDSNLGGKGFNCAITPNDKEVLAYDAASGKWKPKAVNGLSYQGSWDATSLHLPTTSTSGDYFIVSVANSPYQVGDWIVFNGTSFDRIDNSQMITSIFGRTGAVAATEGDYNLTKLSDVTITAPTTNQVLTYDGTSWVNAAVTYSETDPSVSAFAKAALPVCGVGEALKSDGASLSCLPVSVGSVFSGTANRAVITDGTGALASSSLTTTILNYLSNVTSDIQTQINAKLNVSSFVDWSSTGIQTIDPTRLNLTAANRVVVTNGSSNPSASSISSTELGYLSGVTSSVQAQLNSKLSSYAESDPSVTAFAKTALPTCNAGEVLKANGTSLSCVLDNTYSITSTTALTTGSIQTNSQNAVAINPYSTGAGNTGEVRFYELALNGTNYTGFKSPDSLGTNIIYTMPGNAPNAGDVLSSTPGGFLSWAPIPSSPVTSVNSQIGAVTLTTTNVSEGINLYYTDTKARTATVVDVITDGVTNIAPSQNAVFDALALKFNTASYILWNTNGVPTIDPSRLNLGVPSASRAVVTDSSGFMVAGPATSTELGYLSGVSSSIQAQLNGKLGALSPGSITSSHIADGTIVDADLSSISQSKITNLTTDLGSKQNVSTFGADVRGLVLTGLSTLSGNVISATDTLVAALGQLQNQILAVSSLKLDKTGGTLLVGTIDGVPNPTTANQVANKAYVDSVVSSPSATCPTGYVLVPGNVSYFPKQFCVAKYEMKNDGFGTALSIATGNPWTYIIRPDSRSKCQNLGSGYDLISNDQWQTIARNIAETPSNWSSGFVAIGQLNRGHSDNSPTAALSPVIDDNDPCNGTEQTCSATSWNSQRRTHVLSNGSKIWDFAGNVAEWVTNDSNTSNGLDGPMSQMTGADIRQTRYGAATVCASPSSTPYCGMGKGYFNYFAGTVVRGGDWSIGEDAGVFATHLNYTSSTAYANIGFRCVFVP